jgi:hypothetical protein
MDELWVSTKEGRFQVVDADGQSEDTVEPADLVKWKVCLEHKTGVNWHVPSDPPEGRCDHNRLFLFPGQHVTVVPCRIVTAVVLVPVEEEE